MILMTSPNFYSLWGFKLALNISDLALMLFMTVFSSLKSTNICAKALSF